MSKIELIKTNISLLEIAEQYTTLAGRGNRLRCKPNPLRDGGDLDIYEDTQKYYDQGTGESGDVIDFIMIVEELSQSEAISFLLAKCNGNENISYTPRAMPIKKKDNALLQEKLTYKANKYLNTQVPKSTYKNLVKPKYTSFLLEKGEVIKVIQVHTIFEKLFESSYLVIDDDKYIKYLFDEVIGYCDYFDCPLIILRDKHHQVIDIVKYRPQRKGKPLQQGNSTLKYLYRRKEELPDSSYFFPLQAQILDILKNMTHKVCYVGEGLKNAINAYAEGIPFISCGSASNINERFINFLKQLQDKGVKLLGAFDGDDAGENAYKKVTQTIDLKNKFEFNSGIDFTDYLSNRRKEDLRYE